MKKIISAAVSAAFAIGLSVSAASAEIPSAGKVETEGGRLNIRSTASYTAPVIGSLYPGSYVTLLEKSGEWWRVEYSEGSFGYCHSDYIKEVSSSTAKVATEWGNLNIRTGAGLSFPIKGSLQKGEEVLVLSTNGYWSRVLYDGTKTGCVSADYLSVYESGFSAISLSVPDYKQTDSRWKNVTLGSSGKTIGRIGCVTTGIAMMESFRNKSDIFPDAMSEELRYDSAGNVYWPEDYEVNYPDGDYLEKIHEILSEGKPVLIGAKTSSGAQHWVVVTGFYGGEELSPALFSINDPGSSKNKNLGQFFASFPYLYKYFSY